MLKSNGMTITQPADSLRKELMAIGEKMTAEWLAAAGADGKAIIDAYRKK